eukprot:CAMPEP_0176495324 /NCGR_PEP_ID=MMETSP0200_2-20121128/10586_1 /TAXON_ID=947934 /ORGANISM="Chaetoceros sp., Strain GSL56" /LENGTH=1214 /DNA_ID=CAMNT_0017893175 /DNA_START=711 /DNA_END=4355 /DNA_ORIENTATION=-
MRSQTKEELNLEASRIDPASHSRHRSSSLDSCREEGQQQQTTKGVESDEQSQQQQFIQYPRQRPPIPKSKPQMPQTSSMNGNLDGIQDLNRTTVHAIANTGSQNKTLNQDIGSGSIIQEASKVTAFPVVIQREDVGASKGEAENKRDSISLTTVGQGSERSDVSLGGSSLHRREMSLESLPSQGLEQNTVSMATGSTTGAQMTGSACYSHQQVTNNYQPQQQQQQQQTLQQQSVTEVGLISNEIHNVDIAIDSILNSPRAKDEIVEKSPGGRYLRFSEKLGSGAYKEVFRAYDTSEGIEVAWNVVNLSGVPSVERRYIVNEVKLLEKLNHSNIISFHGSWVNRELEQVIFVTEILSSGTLKQFINKVQIIRYKIAKRWAVQILKGLEYLHSQEPPIIHRDLKCDNIFINGTSGDLRIGDLGLSTVISNKSKVLSVLGTPEFMAPELYDESYDEKVDIYAFGMCMLEIFTKEVPYSECSNPAQIYKKVTSGIEPESIGRIRNSSARDFIRQCLGMRDENGRVIRPSASELLGHPFLTKREDDSNQVEVDPPLRERSIQEGSATNSGGTYSMVNAEPVMQSNSGADRRPSTQGRLPSPADNMMGTAQNIDAGQLPLVPQLTKPPLSPRRQSMEFVEIPTITVNDSSQHHMQPNQASNHQEAFDFDSMPDREINMRPVKVLMGRGHEVDASNGQNHLPIPVQTDVTPQISNCPSPQPSPPPSQVPAQSYQVKSLVTPNEESAVVATSLESNERGGHQMPSINSTRKYLQMATILDDDKNYINDIIQLGLYLTVGNKKHIQLGFHLIQDDPIQIAREIVGELNLPSDAILEISETISSMARQARIQQEMYKTMLIQQAAPSIINHNHHNVDATQRTAQNYPHLSRSTSFNYEIRVESNAEGLATSAQNESFTSISISDVPNIPRQTPPLSGAVWNTRQGNDTDDSFRPQQNSSYPSSYVPTNDGTANTPLMNLPSSTYHKSSSSFSTIDNLGHIEHPLAPQPDAPRPNSGVISNSAAMEPQSNANIVAGATGSIPAHHISPPTVHDASHELHCESEDEISNSEEIQQLKLEHEKKLLRAQKVFQTRMESLQRSLEEKEAQHLKTLEKHERDRAALEKRLKMAEEEQQKRLKQIEEEFVQQRQMAKQSKKLSRVISQPFAPPQPSLEGDEVTLALEARLSNFDLLSLTDKSSCMNGDAPEATTNAPSPPASEEEIFSNR